MIEATITCGLFMSSSLSPVAYSMAWDAPCDFGCVTLLLNLFSPFGTVGLASLFCDSSISACFSGAAIAVVLKRFLDTRWNA